MNIATRTMLAVAAVISLALPTSAVYAHGGNASLVHACDTTIFAYIVGPNQTCNLGGSPVHWNITGVAGPTGLTGAPGPAGTNGVNGTDGAPGPQGIAGRDGDAGLKGDKGDKGDTGDVGPQGPPGQAASTDCPPDSVPVGTMCMDTYEASVWETTDAGLIAAIRDGIVTLGDLQAVGAIQRGVSGDDYGAGCPDTGDGCVNFYAVSIAGVKPSRYINWFQAAVSARNSGKRLPANIEWQVAAVGTPDSAPFSSTECNAQHDTSPSLVTTTGSRINCVSDVGAYDMVGNAGEWVADWEASHPNCQNVAVNTAPIFPATQDTNTNCAGVGSTPGPSALIRGGSFPEGVHAGVFAIESTYPTTNAHVHVGFRAAR